MSLGFIFRLPLVSRSNSVADCCLGKPMIAPRLLHNGSTISDCDSEEQDFDLGGYIDGVHGGSL